MSTWYIPLEEGQVVPVLSVLQSLQEKASTLEEQRVCAMLFHLLEREVQEEGLVRAVLLTGSKEDVEETLSSIRGGYRRFQLLQKLEALEKGGSPL